MMIINISSSVLLLGNILMMSKNKQRILLHMTIREKKRSFFFFLEIHVFCVYICHLFTHAPPSSFLVLLRISRRNFSFSLFTFFLFLLFYRIELFSFVQTTNTYIEHKQERFLFFFFFFKMKYCEFLSYGNYIKIEFSSLDFSLSLSLSLLMIDELRKERNEQLQLFVVQNKIEFPRTIRNSIDFHQ